MARLTRKYRNGLVIAEAIRVIDDKLGQFSDYEGNENGPTWYMWTRGVDKFELRCNQAIELHQRAIKIWEDARLINDNVVVRGRLYETDHSI